MVTVEQAEYAGGYRIRLRFNSGEEGAVDLSDIIARYSAASPLRDHEVFSNFYLDEWPTLAWSFGFDLSPETLFERVTGKPPSWLRASPDSENLSAEDRTVLSPPNSVVTPQRHPQRVDRQSLAIAGYNRITGDEGIWGMPKL